MKKNLATLLTREQITTALEYIQQNNIPLEESTKFDLIYNGRAFPPKEVVRQAARLAGTTDLSKYRLNGGPPTNNPLQKLGFTIQEKNASDPGGPVELIEALRSHLDKTTTGSSFGTYRYVEKNTALAFGTPGGKHDPEQNPGYVFSNNANELLFRFFISGGPAYIAVENLKRQTQLANFSLIAGKTFFNENGSVQLRENYRITVRTAQSYQTSRDAMIKAGFPEDDTILSYENPAADAKEIIENLLDWAEIREKAKDLIRLPEAGEQQEIVPGDSSTEGMELNVILYGPPGTGKTYSTIDKALAIVAPDFYRQYKDDREKLTKRFRDLLIKDWNDPIGKIAFVTFHQSTSYEDFIEGIKPDIIEGADSEKENIAYDIQDGIFKLIAEKASWKKGNFDEVFEAFKNSIDQTKGNEPLTITAKETIFGVVYRGTTVLNVNPKSSKKENPWYPVSIVNIRKVYETGNYKGVYNPTYVREILRYLKEKKGLLDPSDATKPEPHVLIIDEINRGNVAQIFGELITLLEPDKRENRNEALSVILPYSKQPFSVPENLYVIGTMNTADRSVEALDTALRRRFYFEELPPRPSLLTPARMLWKFWWDNKGFSWEESDYLHRETAFYELLGFPVENNNKEFKDKYWVPFWEAKMPDETQINSLADLAKTFTGIDLSRLLTFINRRIERLLGKDHLIGHAYFINIESVQDLKRVIFNKLFPLLQEYFYGDYGRMGLVIGKAFLETQKKDAVLFMKIDDYEIPDLYETNIYNIRKVEEFEDDDKFITAVKAIYERQ